MWVKLFKNAIKICYSKRQCVSASRVLRPWTPLGDFHPQTPRFCTSKNSFKNPLLPSVKNLRP